MKIKYNKLLQLGAFMAAGHIVAHTANKIISYTDYAPSASEPLPILAGLLGVGIIAVALGKAINNLIINNLKKDKDGIPFIDLNFKKDQTEGSFIQFESKKPKMR